MKYFLLFLYTCIIFTAGAQKLLPFQNASKKWGYKDASGKVVVPATYTYCGPQSANGLAAVFKDVGSGGAVMDATGKLLTPFKYGQINPYVNGLAAVSNGEESENRENGKYGKWGFIDVKGKEVIPTIYEDVTGDFDGGSYVIATLNGEQLVIDKNGHTIHFNTCDKLEGNFYHSNIARAVKNGKYGMVDKTGKVVVPFEYDLLNDPSEGLIPAQKNSRWGYINDKNVWVVQPKFKEAGDFKNGVAIVGVGTSQYGCINKAGQPTIPFIYQRIDMPLDPAVNIVKVLQMEKLGLMDRVSGKQILPFKYDFIGEFEAGVNTVKLGEKWGLVNLRGEELVPPQYDMIGSVNDGLMRVEKNNKWGYIDITGKLVIPLQFDYALEFLGGAALVTKDGKEFLIDKKGNALKE